MARMIRIAVTVFALCAFLAAESSADETPPGVKPRVAALGGFFLVFKTWPLPRELVEVLEGKLKNARYRLGETFPGRRSWYVRPREWPGPEYPARVFGTDA